MTAATVGATIGAMGVVLGVLFGQSRQEFGRARIRATSLARDVQVIGGSLFNGLTRQGTLPPDGWGTDYYRFGAALLELTDCCYAIRSSKWSGLATRRKYANALTALGAPDEQWAGVQLKLFHRKKPLTENDIGTAILATGGVGRILRPGAPSDPSKYIDELRENANR